MILVYRSDGSIHQSFLGFGTVTIGSNGTLLIDGTDTTTCAADVLWKYTEDQVLETDGNGVYLRGADYYDALSPTPVPISDQIVALQTQLNDVSDAFIDYVISGV